jgi:uncharacterized OB-fold protein
LTDRNRAFWASGADNILRIARCQGCGFYMHPPKPVCPQCRSFEIAWTPVSGRGTIYSWTVNRYTWTPELPPPYVLAEVELVEQPGLRLTSQIVGVDPTGEDVRIGMPVTVEFERTADVWAPVFRP